MLFQNEGRLDLTSSEITGINGGRGAVTWLQQQQQQQQQQQKAMV
jgi:hypothetical protein